MNHPKTRRSLSASSLMICTREQFERLDMKKRRLGIFYLQWHMLVVVKVACGMPAWGAQPGACATPMLVPGQSLAWHGATRKHRLNQAPSLPATDVQIADAGLAMALRDY